MAQGEWAKTKQLIDAAIAVLEDEHPMTIRQLFYRLVSTTVIENDVSSYRRVIKTMTKARDDKRVDYGWIVDRSRANYGGGGWSDLASMAEEMDDMLSYYRRDYWQDQPHYVEIWCEKDAVIGSIEEVYEDYGVSVEAMRGFTSTTKVWEAASRLARYQSQGKKITILYLGDWDPSGAEIERDLRARLRQQRKHLLLELRRVAIFRSDIRNFRLPPLRVKSSDPRSGGFLRQHGAGAVELDALPPTELRRRLRAAIDRVIDQEIWERSRIVEEAQRETCNRYIGTLKEMGAE